MLKIITPPGFTFKSLFLTYLDEYADEQRRKMFDSVKVPQEYLDNHRPSSYELAYMQETIFEKKINVMRDKIFYSMYEPKSCQVSLSRFVNLVIKIIDVRAKFPKKKIRFIKRMRKYSKKLSYSDKVYIASLVNIKKNQK